MDPSSAPAPTVLERLAAVTSSLQKAHIGEDRLHAVQAAVHELASILTAIHTPAPEDTPHA